MVTLFRSTSKRPRSWEACEMPILALLSGFSGLATTKQVFEWIDPNGNHTVLNTPWDYDGRFMPPVEYLSDKLPGRDGEFFRRVRHTPRTIKIPVYITAGCQYTSADLRVSIRDLVNAMDPSNGIGTLRVTNPGGEDRKSTRLNSSHTVISYAVFCLKK